MGIPTAIKINAAEGNDVKRVLALAKFTREHYPEEAIRGYRAGQRTR